MRRTRSHATTEECCADGLVGVRPYGIASSQQQPLPIDLDIPVRLYIGIQVAYPPKLAGRANTLDSVSHWDSGSTSQWTNPDAALESHQGIICQDRKGKEPYDEEHRNRYD